MGRYTTIILSLMMIATVYAGVGHNVSAAPFSGTIDFYDWDLNPQNYFDTSEGIYFTVTVLDNSTPLQYEWVDVIIVGDDGIGEVFNDTYQTDDYGQFDGYNGDDSWYTHDIGIYIMYVNYSGSNVVNESFRIYTPIPWTATGWTTYYGDPTDTFQEDQRVQINVVAEDQFGNPFDGGYGDVWYEVWKDAEVVDYEYLSTDTTGWASGEFRTDWEYANQFGKYMVQIYNDAFPARTLGFINFTVELPYLADIWPQNGGTNRTVFTVGESVGCHVILYNDTGELYVSEDYAARIVVYHEGDDTPLANDTIDTGWDGVYYDWNMMWIGYGEDAYGIYDMVAYDHDWNIIGSATFMVVDLDIEIAPDKAVYAQNDAVTLIVRTSLEQAYIVKVTYPNHNALPSSTWNVPADTSEWRQPYTMPDINDGTYYVEVYLGNLLLDSYQFELKKFTLEVRLSQDAFVPGQSGVLYWMAIDNHNGGPISIDGDADMVYVDQSWNTQSMNLNDISGSSGHFAFDIPESVLISQSVYIYVEAVDANSHYDSETVYLDIGTLAVDVDTDRTTYMPGENVLFTIFTHVSGTDSPVPNTRLSTHVEKDGDNVGAAWSGYSNSAGTVSFFFAIPTAAEDGQHTLYVYSSFSINIMNTTEDFMVSSEEVLALILYREQMHYMPGETVSIQYRVLDGGAEITTASVAFEAKVSDTLSYSYLTDTIAMGFGSGGYITFTLPDDREGYIIVYAQAQLADGRQAFAQIYTTGFYVSYADIQLYTENGTYLPGQKIVWHYSLSGDSIVTTRYRITDPDGVVLAEGYATNGTFEYTLPTEYARTPTATIYITGANGIYTEMNTPALFNGFIIQYTLDKSAYKAGGVIRINYTISKIGVTPDVDGYLITVTVAGETSITIWTDDMTGDIEYLLPEDIEDGRHIITVALQGGGFTDTQDFLVDANAGELAHGTILGMNASAFVALLVAIFALIIGLIAVLKLRQLAGPAKPKKAKEPKEPETPQEPEYQQTYQPPEGPQQPEMPPAPTEQYHYPPPPPENTQ